MISKVEKRCKGKRCIVVGSAPNVRLPAGRQGDVNIGANGGAEIISQNGRVVDVFCTTAHLFRDENVSRQELETLSLLSTVDEVESVWVDTKNGGLGRVIGELDRREIAWRFARAVPPDERSNIIALATGKDLWGSTGVFAVCLAIVSGAKKVIVTGISLSTGHSRMPWDDAPRDHLTEDEQAIKILGERPGVEFLGVAP